MFVCDEVGRVIAGGEVSEYREPVREALEKFKRERKTTDRFKIVFFLSLPVMFFVVPSFLTNDVAMLAVWAMFGILFVGAWVVMHRELCPRCDVRIHYHRKPMKMSTWTNDLCGNCEYDFSRIDAVLKSYEV